jgi:hypothetical protein
MAGLFGFLKKKDRQDVAIVDVGDILLYSLDKVEGEQIVANDSACKAWGIHGGNQFIDRETGRMTQLLSAWSNCPVQIFGSKIEELTKDNINALASRTTDDEITWKDAERKKKANSQFWYGIIATALGLPIGIALLVQSCR